MEYLCKIGMDSTLNQKDPEVNDEVATILRVI